MGTSQRKGHFRLLDDTSLRGAKATASWPFFLTLCHPACCVPSPLCSPQQSTGGDLCPWILIAPACLLNAPGLSV